MVHFILALGIDLIGSVVGKIGVGFLDHLPHDVGVIDDHAGPQVILVMGLSPPNGPKQLAVQSLGQADILYVVHGNVRVYARLHISVGIDMEIPPPSGDTPVHMGAIIPEVQYEEGPRSPDLNHPLAQMVSLFRRHHEGKIRLSVDGKIEEVHLGNGTLVDQHIDELRG